MINNLKDIPVDSIVKIESIDPCHFEKRLIDMGFYPGRQVKVKFKAPFKDPIAVQVGSSTVMLRSDEAEMIRVEQSEE